jgi:hypothetical protein
MQTHRIANDVTNTSYRAVPREENRLHGSANHGDQRAMRATDGYRISQEILCGRIAQARHLPRGEVLS